MPRFKCINGVRYDIIVFFGHTKHQCRHLVNYLILCIIPLFYEMIAFLILLRYF